jgi:hypothetical protein
MEVLMAEGKKALAQKVVDAMLRANPNHLSPEDRARQTRINTGTETKNTAVSFYADYNSEEKLKSLLQIYNSKK